jgi:hypothetical protein
MDSTGDWLGRELERSERFIRDIERWRADDRRDRRATQRFSEYASIEAMRAQVRTAGLEPRHERDYAWSDDRVDRHSNDPAPNKPNAHLEHHARRLETRAFYYLRASNASGLLAYARGSELGLPIPGAIASLPAPAGAAASSIASRFNGDPRWSERTRNIAWTRHVGGAAIDETFYFYVGNSWATQHPENGPPASVEDPAGKRRLAGENRNSRKRPGTPR